MQLPIFAADDIIKMSKKNAAKGKRPPRPPVSDYSLPEKVVFSK